MEDITSSNRKISRIVVILFLSAFLLYGVGSAVATTFAAAPGYLAVISENTLFAAGALLMLLNSAVVLGIGILMFPILTAHNRNVALGYFSTRVFEATFLAVGAISLLSLMAISRAYVAAGSVATAYFGTMGMVASNANFVAYNVAMAGLGIGSLSFCYALFRSRLVPQFLAIWGFFGYAAFAAGCVLELLGFAGTGLVTTIPGGLFDVFFGIWLITKGFSPSVPAAARANTGSPVVP